MNILVYAGPDASPPSLNGALSSLRALLVPNYAVQSVTSRSLSAHPWAATCSLLVLPSLLPRATSSSGLSLESNSGPALTPPAAKEIQNYVVGGGRLLVLGTGLRVDSRRTNTTLSLASQFAGITILNNVPQGTSGDPKLTIEDPDTRLSFSLAAADTQKSAASQLTVTVQPLEGTIIDGLLCDGEIDLSNVENPETKGLETLAHVECAATATPAGCHAHIGRGSAAFWSVHLECPLTNDKDDRARLALLRQTLERLRLRLPESIPEHPPRPLPQILTAAPWRMGVVEDILSALGITSLSEPFELKDSNDTFRIHAHTDAARVIADLRAAARAMGDDPASWTAKHVVAYTGNALPPSDLAPRFDIARYYDELKHARQEHALPDSYPRANGTITSTQTLLDKNTRLLSTLPPPLLSLASAQLAGRGRGSNVWLTPPGCLSFSLLLRVPLAALPAPKIVFVQYLFALAVAEACRAPGVLGGDRTGERVRIKWPNDLYAITPDGERKKIGGILVNTSFGAGKADIVVGCGLNVLSAPPITSLAQLLPASAPRPTLERTLAAVMARFERMWAEFVRGRGSFAPFMDLYLERWLHSDQLVTLTTLTPPREVRIVGITPDHGLLRTLPEREPAFGGMGGGGGGGGGLEFIDLQPDGNSFDLMAGLIKTKT
ncbi:hypothetical protein C8Q80DRAFT_1217458 [Daedaleopsis nitida]|nr:hypothetical protein C8Q80DRAFT_1217458 [Daedaleopsis nitida]